MNAWTLHTRQRTTCKQTSLWTHVLCWVQGSDTHYQLETKNTSIMYSRPRVHLLCTHIYGEYDFPCTQHFSSSLVFLPFVLWSLLDTCVAISLKEEMVPGTTRNFSAMNPVAMKNAGCITPLRINTLCCQQKVSWLVLVESSGNFKIL